MLTSHSSDAGAVAVPGKKHTYVPPVSVEEARNRLAKLGHEVEDIAQQISIYNLAPDKSGKNEAWRVDARLAQLAKKRELALIKSYLREHWPDDPITLLFQYMSMTGRWMEQGFEPSAQEAKVIDATKELLKLHRKIDL